MSETWQEGSHLDIHVSKTLLISKSTKPSHQVSNMSICLYVGDFANRYIEEEV